MQIRISQFWNNLPLAWKIVSVFVALIFLGISTRIIFLAYLAVVILIILVLYGVFEIEF